jgi:hypothetical protein
MIKRGIIVLGTKINHDSPPTFLYSDPPVRLPEFMVSPLESGIAGQVYDVGIRIPIELMQKTSWGQLVIPEAALRTQVTEVASGREISHTLEQQASTDGSTDIVVTVRFTPTKAIPTYVMAWWQDQVLQEAPRIITVHPGRLNA